MRFPRWFRLLPSLVALPCLSAVALAESPPSRCYRRAEFRPPEETFRKGSLPANAPAMVFIPSQGWGAHPVQDYEIELRDQDQTVVPVSFEAEGDRYLIRPARAMNGPQLSMRYRDLCGSFPATYTFPVTVTAPAALPTSAGTARLRNEHADYSGLPSCLPAKVHMVVDVTMSPELRAYRGLTRWEITYKGKTTTVAYGDLQSSDEVAYVQLEDLCGPGVESVGGPVTIAAHVAGATSDPPPLQLTVNARCPYFGTEKAPPACTVIEPAPVEPAPSPDGGGWVMVIDAGVVADVTNDHAGPGAPVSDAGVIGEVAQMPPRNGGAAANGSGGGCRVASAAESDGPGPLAAAGLALLGIALLGRARARGDVRRQAR